MIKAIKSFWAFTSFGYRLVTLLVVPVLIILINILGLLLGEALFGVIFLMTSYALFLMIFDIMADKWFLNGVYGKHNSSLEFLQTSNDFESLIYRVVIVDMVRRLLLYVGMYIVLIILGKCMIGEMDYYGIYAYLPLYMFIINQVAVGIERHFSTWQSVWATSCMASAVSSFGLSFMTTGSIFLCERNGELLLQVLLLLIAIAVCVGTVWYSRKKVRESYYDK